jgi:hypothetical protein
MAVAIAGVAAKVEKVAAAAATVTITRRFLSLRNSVMNQIPDRRSHVPPLIDGEGRMPAGST